MSMRMLGHAHNRSQVLCKAEGGKGFGAVKPPKTAAKKKAKVAIVDNKTDAVEQAVKLAGGSKNDPIDAKEAAQGRVDYAKVKSWGPDSQKDPGSLQVQQFFPGQDQNVESMPLYRRLGVRVMQAKESGVLDQVVEEKLPVPPPAELPDPRLWKFTKANYIQYLVDLQALHHALESGVAEASAARPEGDKLKAACDCLGESQGLARSLEIATDLTNLDHSMNDPDHPGPSLHIKAQLKYLEELTQDVGNEQSALKLLTHAYCLQLYHFTRGSQEGSKMAQALNLFRLNAVHLYRSYPQHNEFPNKDPFKAFGVYVDQLGEHLSEKQIGIIEEELPLGLAYMVMLIIPMAKT